MEEPRFAVIGLGATGTVLAAALLGRYPETILIGTRAEQGSILKEKGIHVSGALSYDISVHNFSQLISDLNESHPNIVFIATKTFHLADVLKYLKSSCHSDTYFVCTNNGLGPEDLVSEILDTDAVFRMSLNYGVSLTSTGNADVTFFNNPNHLGGISDQYRTLGVKIAEILTQAGLHTEFVDNIRLQVWKKMIMKCTMASICAVTDRTIKEALEFPPTREIAQNCFEEALAVARAMGYELGEDYMNQLMGYLSKVGIHKDSMCYDIADKKPTEIDFLGGKIVEYGRQTGVPTPCYVTMTNLVKALEAMY